MLRGIPPFILALLCAAPAFGATIYIPDDYLTIQAAIDASKNGDTLIVKPGTYVENIDFNGKSVALRSEQGPDVTVIDGNQSGSVVSIHWGEGPSTVLQGFTITNGRAGGGGGIWCEIHVSPKILNNIIVDNSASIGGVCLGGGIYCKYDCSPLIAGNLIHGNSAEGTLRSYGGGLYITDRSNPVIINNSIVGNTAIGGNWDKGGGIYCKDESSPVLINNIIAQNSASGGTWSHGGGLYFYNDCLPKIINSTITENETLNASWRHGGGIYCSASSVELQNSILWKNKAYKGREIYLDHKSALTINYSDITDNNKKSVFVESGSTYNEGSHVIHADPLFVDPSHNEFHLIWRSPCINMGSNDIAPRNDIDGDQRPCMGTADMGFDEFAGIHSLACDAFTISEAAGGVLHFTLNGGGGNGGRNYMILGSVSGTVPGTPLPGGSEIVPLNWDMFTNIVCHVNYPDSILFKDFYGTLDPNGQMAAVFDTNGPVRGMKGCMVSFAYLLEGSPWDLASNPINVEVTE